MGLPHQRQTLNGEDIMEEDIMAVDTMEEDIIGVVSDVTWQQML